MMLEISIVGTDPTVIGRAYLQHYDLAGKCKAEVVRSASTVLYSYCSKNKLIELAVRADSVPGNLRVHFYIPNPVSIGNATLMWADFREFIRTQVTTEGVWRQDGTSGQFLLKDEPVPHLLLSHGHELVRRYAS